MANNAIQRRLVRILARERRLAERLAEAGHIRSTGLQRLDGERRALAWALEELAKVHPDSIEYARRKFNCAEARREQRNEERRAFVVVRENAAKEAGDGDEG